MNYVNKIPYLFFVKALFLTSPLDKTDFEQLTPVI